MAGWTLSGTYLEFCSCDPGCGCNFRGSPNSVEGNCQALIAHRVEDGGFDGLDLTGSRIAWALWWPGAIHEGGGRGHASPSRFAVAASLLLRRCPSKPGPGTRSPRNEERTRAGTTAPRNAGTGSRGMAVDAVPGHGRGPGPGGTRNAPVLVRRLLATAGRGPGARPGTRSWGTAVDAVPGHGWGPGHDVTIAPGRSATPTS